MKTVVGQDGTIENIGDIQPDSSLLTDFSVLDPVVLTNSIRLSSSIGIASPSPVTPGIGIFVTNSDQSLFATTSSAEISAGSPGSSGITTTADVIATFPVSTSLLTYAPLVITPVFGTSITGLTGLGGDPTTASEVEAAIDAAINYYDSKWTSDVPTGTSVNRTIISAVSISIAFDYGKVGARTLTNGDGASNSSYGLTDVGDGHYAAFHSAVSGVLPNLPAADPTGGGIILETNAQSQLLGLSAGGAAVAGNVGLNTIANGVTLDYNLANQSITGEVGAVGLIEHEISEVFGRAADLGAIGPNTFTVLDLYRFTAANTPALTAGAADYFSLDNGTTALGYFNNQAVNGGDSGDWVSSGPHNVVADAFDAFLTTGTAGIVSNLDTGVLGAIGLRANIVSPRTLAWTGAQGTDFATAADWNDNTNALNPALAAPVAADVVQFLAGGGTVTGSGTVAALQFGGPAPWDVASGASLSATKGVTVGQGGTAALLVKGGASINGLGPSDIISGAAGSAGLVTVDGTRSGWKSAGELTVGDVGGGSLTISNSASVSAAATALVSAMVLGAGAGGNGTLLVTGAGSRARLVGQLNVGASGTGSLTVAQQATVVSGGSTLSPGQGIDIGQAGG